MGIVSRDQAGKLLKKGAVGYIAYIVNQPKDKAQVEKVPVIKEFLDVFFEELDTLSPDREIEFVINLLSGAAPILKTPYGMTLAEL